MKQLIIKRILPLFMLTLMVFGGFSTNPLTIQKSFAKTTATDAAADQAAADQAAVDQAAVDQAITPEIPAVNPTNVSTLTTTMENSNLIGTLPSGAVSFSLNGKTLNAVVNADVVTSAIETLKTQKAENKQITNLILKLPNSTVKDISGIQLKIPGALAASLNKENITMDFSQDATTVKLQPKAFITDTYKLFETGKELQIDVAIDSQSLPNKLMLYDKPTTPLSSVFSVKTTINDGISSPTDISPMNKGITLSTTLTDDARNNLSKDAIVTVCSYSPTEQNLVSIPTQYDNEKGIATFNVTASGDYFTASRFVAEGSALSGWFFLIPLALLTLILVFFFFIWNKKRKQNNYVKPSSYKSKNIPADN